MSTRTKILKFQRVTNRRLNQIIYHTTVTDNDLWIYAMTCFYITETDNENELPLLEEALATYESHLSWNYQQGIDDSVTHIKELLGDRFIPYEEEDLEEDEYILSLPSSLPSSLQLSPSPLAFLRVSKL